MILLTPLIITLPLQLKLRKKHEYLRKHFSDYLSNESSKTIFLQPTDKEEIANIISSLNSNIRLLAQIVYLIEYYFFYKMKF